MNELDIPIIKKSFELYKTFHEYRKVIPKQDRFTIFEKADTLIIELVASFLEAGYVQRVNKVGILDKSSVTLNMIRFFIRLMKEIKVIDNKKYIILQEMIDEIGRMLGGWIRSSGTR